MNLTIGIVIAVVAIVALGYLIASRYYVASPDEALIVTGRKTKSSIDASGREIADLTNQRVIVGGGVFVIPFVQRLYRLSLASRKIVMQIEAIDINSIPIDVKAVAVVKIGGTETAIRSAAQRFLNQQNQMADTVQELMAGSLRSVIGSMNVKEIITDREALSTKVLQAAQESLTEQGLTLDTLQVQDISDANGYLESMSAPKVAEVRREANIANAAAHQKSEEARIEAERQVVLKSKDLALQKAAIKVETDRADAQASAAGPIQAAQMDREIATSQNQAAKERAELRATELIAEVERPADAARYKTVVEAEASKSQAIAQAEARARAATIEAEARAAASKIEAQARAEARRAEAGAEAEAVRLAGQAEADKTAAMARAEAERALNVGKAEAEATSAKAEAMRAYGEAAVLQMVVDQLPSIVREMAAPLSSIDQMSVVSTDGATPLVKTVASGIGQTTELVKGLTGVDLAGLFHNASTDATNAPDVPGGSAGSSSKA